MAPVLEDSMPAEGLKELSEHDRQDEQRDRARLCRANATDFKSRTSTADSKTRGTVPDYKSRAIVTATVTATATRDHDRLRQGDRARLQDQSIVPNSRSEQSIVPDFKIRATATATDYRSRRSVPD
ncbi:hypothetical protein B0H67DRAFT_638110 [Lasiosphaeris hirsuta]|uniref:Uncharacterized protein n=1 Tax=Lasiosphaeris hirsuta TaxID=260670 RepID=A0AA40B8C0_9PEZI|nr:hypothetical protein B0H67DRAFT_638110 [Lasiosphaeris hirsuta]